MPKRAKLPSPPFQINLEMGSTWEELERLLPLGIPKDWQIITTKLSPSQSGLTKLWEARESPAPSSAKLQLVFHSVTKRTIANISLPVTKVEFTIDSGEETHNQQIFQRLMLALQRGGG